MSQAGQQAAENGGRRQSLRTPNVERVQDIIAAEKEPLPADKTKKRRRKRRKTTSGAQDDDESEFEDDEEDDSSGDDDIVEVIPNEEVRSVQFRRRVSEQHL